MTTTVANQPNGALAQKPRPTTLKGWLQGDDFKAAVAQALPRHCTPERFIRSAITALTRTPDLQNCEPAGFLSAMITLSQYGLEPDGRRAHLIPFRNNKRGVTEVQLIIDYKGLAELVMRSGVVSYVHADIVCEKDVFEHDKGEVKRHTIDFKSQSRGAVYAAYALCRFKDGTEKAEVMTRAEIEAIRGRSRAGRSGPWVTDWNEMAKKTAFRRLSKWLPLSSEIREAIEVDDDRLETESLRQVASTTEGESRSDQLAALLSSGASMPESIDISEPETKEAEAPKSGASVADPSGDALAPLRKSLMECQGMSRLDSIAAAWQGPESRLNEEDMQKAGEMIDARRREIEARAAAKSPGQGSFA